jgi:hypothetical protein
MLRPDTTALEITCSTRCGARGIKLYGLAFTLQPQTWPLSTLEPGVAEKLVRHAELCVKQLDRRPEVLPGITPTERTGDTPAETPLAKAEKPKRRKKKTEG